MDDVVVRNPGVALRDPTLIDAALRSGLALVAVRSTALAQKAGVGAKQAQRFLRGERVGAATEALLRRALGL
jgi:hypothetical protein